MFVNYKSIILIMEVIVLSIHSSLLKLLIKLRKVNHKIYKSRKLKLRYLEKTLPLSKQLLKRQDNGRKSIKLLMKSPTLNYLNLMTLATSMVIISLEK